MTVARRLGQIASSRPQHINGSATGTPEDVDLTKDNDGRTIPNYMSMYNSGANALEFSFDSGTNFATLVSGGSFELHDPGKTITLQSSSGTDYEIITTYARYQG